MIYQNVLSKHSGRKPTYELLVLALLMRWPLHGYLIVKMANNIIGPEENISRGTVSTLLTRLHQGGLVELAGDESEAQPSNHAARIYAITAEGRKRFEQLMLEIPVQPGTYSRLFHIKALHLDLIPAEKSQALVDHYLQYCLSVLRNKEADIQSFSFDAQKQKYSASAHLRETALSIMRLKAAQWKQEVEWARLLKESIQFA